MRVTRGCEELEARLDSLLATADGLRQAVVRRERRRAERAEGWQEPLPVELAAAVAFVAQTVADTSDRLARFERVMTALRAGPRRAARPRDRLACEGPPRSPSAARP